ncbi:MAG TPA: PIN domain-containing protein [Solirubrobacteraceae bacterium]|nr:PIN domain-containing protein [Solirubrobacteraceae bacterium]
MSGCVLDTDVVIAALDRHDSHHSKAANGIKAMIEEGMPLLLSLINYAETLVRPAEDDGTLRTAVDALAALGVRLIAPTPAMAVDAARHRALNISLADGFALATAQAYKAHVGSFDRRVRRALPKAGLELAPQLS